MTLFLELLALAGLILLNAFFVAAEYGLVTSRRTRIRELAQAKNRRAMLVLRITGNPPRFIAAMQLGVTLTSIGIGAFGEPLLARQFDPLVASVIAAVIALFVITFVQVIVGELVPKGIALAHPEGTALALSAPIRLFFTVFAPLIWLLERSTELCLRALRQEPPGATRAAHSEAELRMLLSSSAEQGEIERGEQEMVSRVFDFGDKEASDVMVPRPEVAALSVALPPEEALQTVLHSPYTRYPVFRDNVDDIVGILHVRDLIGAMRERDFDAVDIRQILRPAMMVPETKDLAALLAEFRRTQQHIAVVINEYGGMEGIVTLEDVVEEIVGEIEDEFDVPEQAVERVDDDTVRVDGTFNIDDFNARFDAELPAEDYHTVAGFVFGELGRPAEPGDEVRHDGMLFHVEAVEGQRIDRLTVTFERRPPVEEAGE